MATLIKSNQLHPTNFAYIELSEKTLKKQLALLFPFSGAICAVIAFTYFVSDAEFLFHTCRSRWHVPLL